MCAMDQLLVVNYHYLGREKQGLRKWFSSSKQENKNPCLLAAARNINELSPKIWVCFLIFNNSPFLTLLPLLSSRNLPIFLIFCVFGDIPPNSTTTFSLTLASSKQKFSLRQHRKIRQSRQFDHFIRSLKRNLCVPQHQDRCPSVSNLPVQASPKLADWSIG